MFNPVARVGLELFGPSLPGLRLFAALAQGGAMLLAGLMARESLAANSRNVYMRTYGASGGAYKLASRSTTGA